MAKQPTGGGRAICTLQGRAVRTASSGWHWGATKPAEHRLHVKPVVVSHSAQLDTTHGAGLQNSPGPPVAAHDVAFVMPKQPGPWPAMVA
jgi:hypothetical protein